MDDKNIQNLLVNIVLEKKTPILITDFFMPFYFGMN
jgi:hypothetical protein